MKGQAPDRRGLASLFDAFAFLTAMIVLCASFSILTSQGVGEERDWQPRVERAHQVLLASSLQLPENGPGPGEGSPWVRVPSLVQRSEVDGGALPPWAREGVEKAVVELLGPGWGFEWSLEAAGSEHPLASAGARPDGSDVFVSSIGSRGGEGEHYVLRAWRA